MIVLRNGHIMSFSPETTVSEIDELKHLWKSSVLLVSAPCFHVFESQYKTGRVQVKRYRRINEHHTWRGDPDARGDISGLGLHERNHDAEEYVFLNCAPSRAVPVNLLVCMGGRVGQCYGFAAAAIRGSGNFELASYNNDADFVHMDMSMLRHDDRVNIRVAKSQFEGRVVQRIPPEIFALFFAWHTAQVSLALDGPHCWMDTSTLLSGAASRNMAGLAQLSLTCRSWNAIYRPLLWEVVILSNFEDYRSFAHILKLPPPRSYIAISNLVRRVELRVHVLPEPPWIHRVSSVFRQLLPKSVRHSIVIDGWVDPNGNVLASCNPLVTSFARFNMPSQSMMLYGVRFQSPVKLFSFIRPFRHLETLNCSSVLFHGPDSDHTETALYQPQRRPQLKSIVMPTGCAYYGDSDQSSTGATSWVALLWTLLRRRYDGSFDYLLEDMETRIAMRLTALCQVPNLTVPLQVNVCERMVDDRVVGYDFHLKMNGMSDEITLCAVADTELTTPNGTRASRYKALHIVFAVIQMERSAHPMDCMLDDYFSFCGLLSDLPLFRNLVFAYTIPPAEWYNHSPPISFYTHESALRRTGKLVLVQVDGSDVVLVHPSTLEPISDAKGYLSLQTTQWSGTEARLSLTLRAYTSSTAIPISDFCADELESSDSDPPSRPISPMATRSSRSTSPSSDSSSDSDTATRIATSFAFPSHKLLGGLSSA